MIKKMCLKIFSIIFISTLYFNVNAFSYHTCIDEWRNGEAYCNDEKVSVEWSYDVNTKMYVQLDKNGRKIRELKDINEDPQAKKGTIEISANVPESLNDIKIKIDIMSDIYSYSLELNKDNGFKASKEINVDLYNVGYSVEGADELENQLPTQFKIYEGETTSYKIDYSKYKTKKKKEQSKVKKIIVIAAISGIVLAFIIIILMFLKARSL